MFPVNGSYQNSGCLSPEGLVGGRGEACGLCFSGKNKLGKTIPKPPQWIQSEGTVACGRPIQSWISPEDCSTLEVVVLKQEKVSGGKSNKEAVTDSTILPPHILPVPLEDSGRRSLEWSSEVDLCEKEEREDDLKYCLFFLLSTPILLLIPWTNSLKFSLVFF